QEFPRRLVAEERRDVDQDAVEELRKLLGMHFEVLRVALEVLDADELHAPLHTALEARALVAGEVEAALLAQELEQLFQFRVEGFSHRPSRASPAPARSRRARG